MMPLRCVAGGGLQAIEIDVELSIVTFTESGATAGAKNNYNIQYC